MELTFREIILIVTFSQFLNISCIVVCSTDKDCPDGYCNKQTSMKGKCMQGFCSCYVGYYQVVNGPEVKCIRGK